MSKAVSYGYMLPTADSVKVLELKVTIDDEQFSFGSQEPPTWGYESAVSVVALIELDWEEFTRECGFIGFTADEDLPQYSAQINWFATKTKQRGASPREILHDGTNRLSMELESTLLGGELQVSIKIDLAKPGYPLQDAIVATRVGSRLWASETLRLPLEGNAAQMPISPINFKEHGIEPVDAMWKITISPDLRLPVQAGISVLINTSHPMGLRILEKGKGPEKKLWDAYLQTDILVQMLLRAGDIADDKIDETDPLYPGSVAESIQIMVNLLFPTAPVSEIPNDLEAIFSRAQALAFKDLK